jgi:hypothetical protein
MGDCWNVTFELKQSRKNSCAIVRRELKGASDNPFLPALKAASDASSGQRPGFASFSNLERPERAQAFRPFRAEVKTGHDSRGVAPG